MKNRILNALFLVCLFISASIYAQTPPPEPQCSVKGVITSEGAPLPFATVTINNTTLGTASGLDGEFEFGHIPEGEFVVKA
jgi:outer membrane receptor for ferrienterochelin and colicins